MKKNICYALIMLIVVGCGTIQSIVKSTFPYTATLIIPANSKINTPLSATSTASSFDQTFTGQGANTNQIAQVRVASVKLESTNPVDQNLGIIKSANVYLVANNNAILIASRTDIGKTVGRAIMLDIDNSKFLDDYLKSDHLKIKVDYVLQGTIASDLSVKASVGFSTMPASK